MRKFIFIIATIIYATINCYAQDYGGGYGSSNGGGYGSNGGGYTSSYGGDSGGASYGSSTYTGYTGSGITGMGERIPTGENVNTGFTHGSMGGLVNNDHTSHIQNRNNPSYSTPPSPAQYDSSSYTNPGSGETSYGTSGWSPSKYDKYGQPYAGFDKNGGSPPMSIPDYEMSVTGSKYSDHPSFDHNSNNQLDNPVAYGPFGKTSNDYPSVVDPRSNYYKSQATHVDDIYRPTSPKPDWHDTPDGGYESVRAVDKRNGRSGNYTDLGNGNYIFVYDK